MQVPSYDLWTDRRVNIGGSAPGVERRAGDRRKTSRSVEADRRARSKRHSLLHSHKFHGMLLAGGDFLVLVLMFAASAFFVFSNYGWNGSIPMEGLGSGVQRFQVFLALASTTVVGFWLLGHYTRRRAFWDEMRQIIKLLLVFACVDAATSFIWQWEFSRQQMLATWALALVGLPLMRVGIKHGLIAAGGWMRPTVIIGVGENAYVTARALSQEPLLGFNVVSFIEPPSSWAKDLDVNNGARQMFIEVNGHNVPVRHFSGQDPMATLDKLGYPHVVVALDSGDFWEVTKLMYQSGLQDSSLNIVPPIRGLPLIGMEMMHFFKQDILMMRVQNNLARPIPKIVKRTFDIVVSSLLLIVLMPFFAALMPAIRKTTGASAVFGHKRVGYKGREFTCFKFRTMVANADEVLKNLLDNDPLARAEWEADFKLKKDPRVTMIGRFLRKTSLDELPQLWNVLKGEMSLIGPRPIVQDELARYEDKVGYYLEVCPGMTGLWQVSGRNNVAYSARVYLDTWYVKNWTLWYDIVVLLKTVKVVFGDKSAY